MVTVRLRATALEEEFNWSHHNDVCKQEREKAEPTSQVPAFRGSHVYQQQRPTQEEPWHAVSGHFQQQARQLERPHPGVARLCAHAKPLGDVIIQQK